MLVGSHTGLARISSTPGQGSAGSGPGTKIAGFGNGFLRNSPFRVLTWGYAGLRVGPGLAAGAWGRGDRQTDFSGRGFSYSETISLSPGPAGAAIPTDDAATVRARPGAGALHLGGGLGSAGAGISP